MKTKDQKHCPRCSSDKHRDEFHNNAGQPDGKAVWCKACMKIHFNNLTPSQRKRRDETATAWRQVNKEKHALHGKRCRIKREYGITLEEYEKIIAGPCGICGSTPEENKHRHLDHCHDTGKVRGALCNVCNTGLGMFKHNPDLLRKAIAYLKHHA